MNLQRHARLLIAGLVLGAGIGAGALGAIALSGTDPEAEPVPTVVTPDPVVEEPTTVAPVEVPEVPVETLPPVEETKPPETKPYTPGDVLPDRKPLPRAGEQVETVPGPNGPIYPDGYVDPTQTTTPPSAITFQPPCPGAGGNSQPRNADGSCPPVNL